MIKKTIKKIGRVKTFVVLLAGLDAGFAVINGLITYKTTVRKNASLAGAKPSYCEAAPGPARPVLAQTLRPPLQLVTQPVTERPLRKRSG